MCVRLRTDGCNFHTCTCVRWCVPVNDLQAFWDMRGQQTADLIVNPAALLLLGPEIQAGKVGFPPLRRGGGLYSH